ncbi:MAG TPA: ABC transporter ATP-binding protein [Planctomycetota bacterium]|nr:ABC transporter ATP-binding protein [Planctomycetota bacterium]HRR81608.1 ABC transporter ATP-binding protein [Planctomycetota bacterium]HRT93081.1 ABC transporter ATP-binding protein [Planctomycetota bacterium]
MSAAAPLLELVDVSKRYEGPEGAAPPVLRSVRLRVEDGESLAIVGPSGCGKSTLLNLIGALDRPSGGSVHFKGQDLSALDDQALALLRNREIGFIFQLHHLLPQCTVLENVLVPTLVAGGRGDAPEARARSLLARVGLGERLGYFPGQLSGGERQRVAVVRALINRPSLLLADEPTGSLDRAAADNLADLLVELNREEGVALILVTHALDLAAKMGRVLALREGELRAAPP